MTGARPAPLKDRQPARLAGHLQREGYRPANQARPAGHRTDPAIARAAPRLAGRSRPVMAAGSATRAQAQQPARRGWLTWPRLPAAAEAATIGAGYTGYSLVRLGARAGHHAAFAHAAQLRRAEQQVHLAIEPYLNHLTAAHPALAGAAGYYYGLAHFTITPLLLTWLYLRRPAAFPQLRSALFAATTAANAVFWTWPAAPPRLAVPGMTDILATRDILAAAHPHGPTSLVNPYAAMPSLHAAWAAWCALAVVSTTPSRWRHLAWLYPAATTCAVLATGNHFLLDTAGGLVLACLGMLAASQPAAVAVTLAARSADLVASMHRLGGLTGWLAGRHSGTPGRAHAGRRGQPRPAAGRIPVRNRGAAVQQGRWRAGLEIDRR